MKEKWSENLTWEWVQYHQQVYTSGEWDNNHVDKISTEYMTKYDSLPQHPIKRDIHVTRRIKFYINNIEYDNKILTIIRYKKYGKIQKIPIRKIQLAYGYPT